MDKPKTLFRKVRLNIFGPKGFSKVLYRLQTSKAYGTFCEKVYGRNLCQFNVVDEEQLQKLTSELKLNSAHEILDLGCGGGFVSEYISDTTGAKITGIDFARSIIESAQLRTQNKRDRIQFFVGNLNSLPKNLGRFDFVLSLDTLYFINDLPGGLKKFKELLKPQGRFAAFYSYKQKKEVLAEEFGPTNNRLGLALLGAGFTFQTWDFSSNEKRIWEMARIVAEELKEEFEKEGNIDIYKGRVYEAERDLKSLAGGRNARSLYISDQV